MTKPTDIKAFTFLDRDPRQVADELLRAGWDRMDVVAQSGRVMAWARAFRDAFCAAEESQHEGENHE